MLYFLWPLPPDCLETADAWRLTHTCSALFVVITIISIALLYNYCLAEPWIYNTIHFLRWQEQESCSFWCAQQFMCLQCFSLFCFLYLWSAKRRCSATFILYAAKVFTMQKISGGFIWFFFLLRDPGKKPRPNIDTEIKSYVHFDSYIHWNEKRADACLICSSSCFVEYKQIWYVLHVSVLAGRSIALSCNQWLLLHVNK